MIVFGNTCPMCCGDLDVACLGTGTAVCLSCGYNVKASASIPSRAPDAIAFGVSAVAMADPVMARTSERAQADPGDLARSAKETTIGLCEAILPVCSTANPTGGLNVFGKNTEVRPYEESKGKG